MKKDKQIGSDVGSKEVAILEVVRDGFLVAKVTSDYQREQQV